MHRWLQYIDGKLFCFSLERTFGKRFNPTYPPFRLGVWGHMIRRRTSISLQRPDQNFPKFNVWCPDTFWPFWGLWCLDGWSGIAFLGDLVDLSGWWAGIWTLRALLVSGWWSGLCRDNQGSYRGVCDKGHFILQSLISILVGFSADPSGKHSCVICWSLSLPARTGFFDFIFPKPTTAEWNAMHCNWWF